MRVGVLALQGDHAAHRAVLLGLGHEAREVRRRTDLDGVEGVVLPGGESTAMLRLLDADLAGALDELARAGAPVLATCAGLVLCAREVVPEQPSLGWLDVTVARNGWGRQPHSAEARADDGALLVLIRAPRIVRAGAVTVERTLRGEPVLVRRANVWGATYHPELTGDASTHASVFGATAHEARSAIVA